MHPFTYLRATTTEEALKADSANPQSAYLAGGTNLIDWMKEDVMRPSQLVDIRRLPLAQIEDKNGGLRIGAMVTNTELAYHTAVRERYPVLSQALLSGASPQLRNMATVGGNMLQRTRCQYFRDTAFSCNKRLPGSGCPAMPGYHRMHAILGVSDKCIASNPSDMCVALAALDATVHTQGPAGERTIPFNDFHVLPGERPEVETVLQQGELITHVELPALPFAKRSYYLKIRDRASYEFALVSVAAVLDQEGELIKNARLALGGVGTKPWRSRAAEEVLVGKSATEETFKAAATAAVQEAKPLQYNQFKVELVKRAIVRALMTVSASGGGPA